MGLEIKSKEFTDADFSRFSGKLRENLQALKLLLDRPGFGEGDLSFGAELELYIIDREFKPLHINQEIIGKLNDPQLTLELNRYNLEYNFSPVLIKNSCFGTTQKEALAAIQKINNCAAHWQGSVVPIGILPTLQQSDTGYHAMTKLPRFEALTQELTQLRGGPFTIAIEGEDALQLAMDDVTLEGANTSFQFHWLVTPQNFVDTYNAAQMVMPLVVAPMKPVMMGIVLLAKNGRNLAAVFSSVNSNKGAAF